MTREPSLPEKKRTTSAFMSSRSLVLWLVAAICPLALACRVAAVRELHLFYVDASHKFEGAAVVLDGTEVGRLEPVRDLKFRFLTFILGHPPTSTTVELRRDLASTPLQPANQHLVQLVQHGRIVNSLKFNIPTMERPDFISFSAFHNQFDGAVTHHDGSVTFFPGGQTFPAEGDPTPNLSLQRTNPG